MENLNFVTFKNGVVVINTTPHPITFMEEDGTIVSVPTSVIINAKVQEEVVKTSNGVTFVKSTFVGSEEGQKTIETIQQVNPDALIIGSIIAAQTFPKIVFGMTPCKGFERVAPAEKRMSTVKFTTF